MKKDTFRVTYDVVTEESARDGDVSDSGFVSGTGWRDSTSFLTRSSDMSDYDMSLRVAHSLMSGIAHEANESPISNSVRWLTQYESNDGTRAFYEQGETESLSVHIPDSITNASRIRICRLFGLSV